MNGSLPRMSSDALNSFRAFLDVPGITIRLWQTLSGRLQVGRGHLWLFCALRIWRPKPFGVQIRLILRAVCVRGQKRLASARGYAVSTSARSQSAVIPQF
jgi:hypothetical protein